MIADPEVGTPLLFAINAGEWATAAALAVWCEDEADNAVNDGKPASAFIPCERQPAWFDALRRIRTACDSDASLSRSDLDKEVAAARAAAWKEGGLTPHRSKREAARLLVERHRRKSSQSDSNRKSMLSPTSSLSSPKPSRPSSLCSPLPSSPSPTPQPQQPLALASSSSSPPVDRPSSTLPRPPAGTVSLPRCASPGGTLGGQQARPSTASSAPPPRSVLPLPLHTRARTKRSTHFSHTHTCHATMLVEPPQGWHSLSRRSLTAMLSPSL